MLAGKLLMTGGVDKATRVFTPWMARQADNAAFSYERIVVIGAPTLTIEVYHKNTEDTGPGAIRTVTWSGSTFKSATGTGLKEMVRLLVILEPSDEGGAEGVIYRIFEPTWYDDAETS